MPERTSDALNAAVCPEEGLSCMVRSRVSSAAPACKQVVAADDMAAAKASISFACRTWDLRSEPRSCTFLLLLLLLLLLPTRLLLVLLLGPMRVLSGVGLQGPPCSVALPQNASKAVKAVQAAADVGLVCAVLQHTAINTSGTCMHDSKGCFQALGGAYSLIARNGGHF